MHGRLHMPFWGTRMITCGVLSWPLRVGRFLSTQIDMAPYLRPLSGHSCILLLHVMHDPLRGPGALCHRTGAWSPPTARPPEHGVPHDCLRSTEVRLPPTLSASRLPSPIDKLVPLFPLFLLRTVLLHCIAFLGVLLLSTLTRELPQHVT